MTLLGRLRYRGAQVSLAAGGNITIVGAPADLLAEAKTQKAELVAALRSETLGGVPFSSSAQFFRLDELFHVVKRIRSTGTAVPECTRVMQLIYEVDISELLTDFERDVAARRSEISELVKRIVLAAKEGEGLTGSALATMASEVFSAQSSSARQPPKTLNLSALTSIAAAPTQESMAL